MTPREAFSVLSAAVDVVVSVTPLKHRPRVRSLADDFCFSVAVALELVEPWARIKDATGRERETRVDVATREPL